jgi:hypothetical protein
MENAMKRPLTLSVTAVTASMLLGSTALANPYLDQVLKQLNDQGYTVTEIEAREGEFEVTAELAGTEREVVVSTSGSIVSDEISFDDDDDDDDDDDGDDDDDDDGDDDDDDDDDDDGDDDDDEDDEDDDDGDDDDDDDDDED